MFESLTLYLKLSKVLLMIYYEKILKFVEIKINNMFI